MREERHWIVVLPAILVLAAIGLSRVRTPWIGVLAAVPALALFPYGRYSQIKSGYADLLEQLNRPARMLVSSAGSGEGSWIAVVSSAEHRPGSFIIRATKVLA